MSSRTQLVQDIIGIEWDMFSNVHNTGGKASCQNDREDFVIMRKSQFSTWSDETLASYLADLVKAQQDRRNLMSEKYGFMMESTFPDEFAGIADQRTRRPHRRALDFHIFVTSDGCICTAIGIKYGQRCRHSVFHPLVVARQEFIFGNMQR